MKVRYLLDTEPGYGRVRRGRGYYYVDPSGQRITANSKTLSRLQALVIPPAWKDVWISPVKNGHLQATGIDQEGRKQYIYHPEWTKTRQLKKLKRMAGFGKALPYLRRRRSKDLKKRALTRDKVIAIALKVMEETLVRVGSTQYLHKYGNHGLTTLKKKHLHINGNEIAFRFRGKKGVWQDISVRSARLAELLSALSKLKGGYLFQYVAEYGPTRKLSAGDINSYIQQHTALKYSSKDYRTWYAGLWAFRLFAKRPRYDSQKECETTILSVLDAVSSRLGNTRTVCRQYYVPETLVHAYRSGLLAHYFGHDKEDNEASKETSSVRLIAFIEDVLRHDT